MLNVQTLPTPPASVKTDPAKQQKRVVRRLLRDLVCFAGVAAADLASAPRKTPQRSNRVLFRKDLTDADLDRLICEIGAARLMAALDRWTQPNMFSVAAE